MVPWHNCISPECWVTAFDLNGLFPHLDLSMIKGSILGCIVTQLHLYCWYRFTSLTTVSNYRKKYTLVPKDYMCTSFCLFWVSHHTWGTSLLILWLLQMGALTHQIVNSSKCFCWCYSHWLHSVHSALGTRCFLIRRRLQASFDYLIVNKGQWPYVCNVGSVQGLRVCTD